jgi:hypothetical protein
LLTVVDVGVRVGDIVGVGALGGVAAAVGVVVTVTVGVGMAEGIGEGVAPLVGAAAFRTAGKKTWLPEPRSGGRAAAGAGRKRVKRARNNASSNPRRAQGAQPRPITSLLLYAR